MWWLIRLSGAQWRALALDGEQERGGEGNLPCPRAMLAEELGHLALTSPTGRRVLPTESSDEIRGEKVLYWKFDGLRSLT
ncbi:MAG: hypothetical protein EBZ91_14800 [Gammaproteobacteria bacterium]|nr:hypothetical protein [Gammaproteobacteria bacterium]